MLLKLLWKQKWSIFWDTARVLGLLGDVAAGSRTPRHGERKPNV